MTESRAPADGPTRPWLRAHPFGVAIAGIALGGFVLRAYYIASVRAHQKLSGDSLYFYYWGAEALADGRGYLGSVPGHTHLVASAKHAPGLVTLLGGLYRLGFHSPDSLAYWIAALGTVNVVLIGVLAAQVFSRRAGVIAASVAAVYPNLWINDTLLMSETLMVFGFTLGLLGVYAFHRNPRLLSIVVAAIGFTLATSARAESIVLFAIVVLPLVLARRQVPWVRRVGMLTVAAVVPLAMVVPWSIYNSSRFQDRVLLSTGFGPTALAASCDQAFYGSLIGYYSLECSRQNPPPPLPPGESYDESQLNAYATSDAVDYVGNHLRRYPLVVLAREGRLFSVFKPHQNAVIDHFVQNRGSVRLTTVSQWAFWLLALLAVPGAILWRRRRIPLYPLVGELAVTMVVAALTFGSTRYRCGVEVCVVLLAAATLDEASRRLVRRWRQREPVAEARGTTMGEGPTAR